MKNFFAAIVICSSFTGCLGYRIGPIKPYYLQDVHTIAVPTFKNETLIPRIEVLATSTVIKQFQQDGTFAELAQIFNLPNNVGASQQPFRAVRWG